LFEFGDYNFFNNKQLREMDDYINRQNYNILNAFDSFFYE